MKAIKRDIEVSNNPTFEYLSKEIQNSNSKGYMHLYVHCNIITIANIWKQSMYPAINKEIKDRNR